MSLTLNASLIGKAQTSSEQGHVQVTLRVGNQNLYLQLLPEQAAMFPDLVKTVPHATERRRQAIAYNAAPAYTLTIAEVGPEITLARALLNAQAAVTEKRNEAEVKALPLMNAGMASTQAALGKADDAG